MQLFSKKETSWSTIYLLAIVDSIALSGMVTVGLQVVGFYCKSKKQKEV